VQLVRVVIEVGDPLTSDGLAALLGRQPDVELVQPDHRRAADLAVIGVDRLTPDVVAGLRRAAAEFALPVLLVTGDITAGELLLAIECRVVGVIPRAAATADRLIHGVRAAASGGGVLPTNLVGDLLKHVERLRREVLVPQGLDEARLNPREIDVLRLIADGLDTTEIAAKLSYSERTVKKILYGATRRLDLKNRAHAVAYALRRGII